MVERLWKLITLKNEERYWRSGDELNTLSDIC